MGESDITMLITFANINVVLSRHELGAQLAKMKRTWVTRVHELQREPGALEQFQTHVVNLKKESVRKNRELSRGLNFVHENRAAACDRNLISKNVASHYKRVLKNMAKQDAAAQRRAQLADAGMLPLPSLLAEPEWTDEEPNRHLQSIVMSKQLSVETEKIPALPSTAA